MIILRIQIRRVKDSELDQLADIWNDHTDLITTSKLIVNHSGLTNFRNENSNLEYFGAFLHQDNMLIGFITMWEEIDGYYISQIALDADYHGNKVGKALIGHSIELSKKKDFDALKLSVMVINIKGVKFFLALGFEIQDYFVEKHHLPDDFSQIIESQIRLIEYNMVYKIK